MKRPSAALFAVILAACATATPEQQLVWARTDGQRMTGNQTLQGQFQVDATICQGEAQKAGLAGTTLVGGDLGDQIMADISRNNQIGAVLKGCMAEKGYLLVTRADAEARASSLATPASLGPGAASKPQK